MLLQIKLANTFQECAQYIVALWPKCSKLIQTCACLSISAPRAYARLPQRGQRPGWARIESCARQLPAAASDRHSTALISWPVTVDTNSCAALREQAELRRGAARCSSGNTDTDEHIRDFCHRLQDEGGHLMLLPGGHPAASHASLWLLCCSLKSLCT